MPQSTEESNSTEISVKFTVSMAPPFDLVVQSAVRDLSACHAIVLRVGCNIRVITPTVITVCGFHQLDA